MIVADDAPAPELGSLTGLAFFGTTPEEQNRRWTGRSGVCTRRCPGDRDGVLRARGAAELCCRQEFEPDSFVLGAQGRHSASRHRIGARREKVWIMFMPAPYNKETTSGTGTSRSLSTPARRGPIHLARRPSFLAASGATWPRECERRRASGLPFTPRPGAPRRGLPVRPPATRVVPVIVTIPSAAVTSTSVSCVRKSVARARRDPASAA